MGRNHTGGAKFPVLAKIINIILAIISVTGILYTTVLRRSGEMTGRYLQPFHSLMPGVYMSETSRMLLMNAFLFLPYGITMPYALPKRAKYPKTITTLLALLLSAGVEYLQFRYHLGLCETDDVIMNTLGAAFGTLSFVPYRYLQRRTDR